MSVIFLLTLYTGITFAQRIVDTEYGQVRGHVIPVYNGVAQTTVDVFYGVPFGKDTSGPRRFKRPEAPDPWSNILEADTIGEVCPQIRGPIELTNPGWDNYGENCLHLNIYTPTEGQEPYPVMIWLYGGSFQSGANVQYPGHFLASRGVVVVCPNYRLNSFGFSYTGNNASSGNVGLFDQHAAMRWVVNNIANFSGDPGHITLFGESAGAISTTMHMVSPYSKDLFHQAIAQSGTSEMPGAINLPQSQPEIYIRQVAAQTGCDVTGDDAMMDCLRQVPWENIVNNTTVTCAPGFVCFGMSPVIDGPDGFLPQPPADLRANGSVLQGPMIAGINQEDGALAIAFMAPGTLFENCCNRTYFEHVIRSKVVGLFDARLYNQTAEECYNALDYNYSPWPYLEDQWANRDMLVKLWTDWNFGMQWDQQLKSHHAVAPTYGYLFDYMSTNTTSPEWMGTSHMEDLHYVWGLPLLQYNEAIQNDSHCCGDAREYNDLDVQYAIFIQELWSNFAKYGNPTQIPVRNPFGDSTVWSEFTENNMALLYLGDSDVNTLTQYRQRDYALWSEFIPGITEKELGILQ